MSRLTHIDETGRARMVDVSDKPATTREALAGIIDGVFIFCLPGSNGAVRDGWDRVIAPQLDSRHKPCNMVELMPRLLES